MPASFWLGLIVGILLGGIVWPFIYRAWPEERAERTARAKRRLLQTWRRMQSPDD
jgi:hypothetical protein